MLIHVVVKTINYAKGKNSPQKPESRNNTKKMSLILHLSSKIQIKLIAVSLTVGAYIHPMSKCISNPFNIHTKRHAIVASGQMPKPWKLQREMCVIENPFEIALTTANEKTVV